jgi:Putative prokaryotic signal transducing protein
MRDGMTKIKTFTNETEAHMELNRLKAVGIVAFIEADNCGGIHPHLDLTSGVHLLVADEDQEQALAVLSDSTDYITSPAWICESCGENIEPGFDTCWKCGATSGS